MKAKSPVDYFVAALAMVLAGCAATTLPPQAARADSAKAQITILYDAFGKSSGMQKDWGYAALIEYGGKRILFDTGNNGDTLAQNAKAKGIDLSRLDFVVMSHRHGDHMGGVAYLLSVNPRVKIYAPKEGFGVYGGSLPGTFYRRPDPEAEPFFKEGDSVQPGDVIGLVEIMKSFHEVKAESAGVVDEFLVENEGEVDIGQEIMRLR